jgi:hypothetical protein
MVIKCLDFSSSSYNVGQKKKKEKISFSSFLTRSLHGLVGQLNCALTLHTLLTYSLSLSFFFFFSPVQMDTQFEEEVKVRLCLLCLRAISVPLYMYVCIH